MKSIVTRIIVICATLACGLIVPAMIAAGPIQINHCTGVPFQASCDGSDWDFATGATPFTQIPGGQWSSVFGDKFKAMQVPPGNYTVTVQVIAKHNKQGGIGAIGGVFLHSGGGVATTPEYVDVGVGWTPVLFTASRAFTDAELNSGNVNSFLRAFSGSDVDFCRVDIKSVTLYATAN